MGAGYSWPAPITQVLANLQTGFNCFFCKCLYNEDEKSSVSFRKEVEAMLPGGLVCRGQGLVEYALIMLLVALIVIIVLAILGPAVGNMFSEVIPKI